METGWSANCKISPEKAPFDLVANLLDLENVDIFAQVKHRVATLNISLHCLVGYGW